MQVTSLGNIEKLNRKELKAAIEACFEHTSEVSPVDRLAVLQEAQFYMRELERRHDSWISFRDLFLEVVVVGLIGWEIWLGYKEMRTQATEFSQESQILSNMENNSATTSQNLITASNILTTMSGNLQREVDFYYEPSVLVTYRPQFGSHVLDIHNFGRSMISIVGVKSNGKACALQPPLTVSSGAPRPLEPGIFVNDSITRVISSDANTEMTIYFKAKNGEEFLHRALMVRVPVADGTAIILEQQKTERIASSRGLPPFGKCDN
jgi:hypothetical protein